jgi:tetratricopeptide (TPR) repeat protein
LIIRKCLSIPKGNQPGTAAPKEFYQQQLELATDVGDRRGKSTALCGLGEVHHQLGQYHRAIEYYLQALDITRDIRNLQGEMDVLKRLDNARQQQHK